MNVVTRSSPDFNYSMLVKLIVALWRHMAIEIWVPIVSDNGLLPDGTKPLPEPMLTYHH